jgi:hypothetical protein
MLGQDGEELFALLAKHKFTLEGKSSELRAVPKSDGYQRKLLNFELPGIK